MIKHIRKLLRWMPGSWKGVVDYYFDSNAGKEFGGPLNGQKQRVAIFIEMLGAIPFQAIVETGAFRGVTTKFFAEQTKLPVFSVEIEPRFFQYSKRSLRSFAKVNLRLGDSRAFLDSLVADTSCPKSNVFFYLDAHWQDDLPLFEELVRIGDHWRNSVVMIDDFCVPDDPGYFFDDYGDGAKLCLEYISPLLNNTWSVFFPRARAEDETSGKRGCVVMVNRDLEEKFNQIKSLRYYETTAKSDLVGKT